MEVLAETTPLKSGPRVLAQLKKGRLLYTSEVKGDWALVRVLEKGEVIRGYVRKTDLQPVAEEPPPRKSLALSQGNDFASAAMLIQKAKQFDDGLYAAVELATQEGQGSVIGKRIWLTELAGKVDAKRGGVPLAQLYAALELGGVGSKTPAALQAAVAAERKEFLADEKRSKPIGFYTWGPQFEQIFQQDRLLQTPLLADDHAAGIQTITAALAHDKEARKSYETYLALYARLTNPFMSRSYQDLLAAAKSGEPLQFAPRESIAFFPASRGHETDLGIKLYGGRPIPEGFDLMREVIARLKSGDLSFQPQETSGWYDHQLWSLEPLIRLDAAPEGKRLDRNEEYVKHLEELFKGTYALTRETHVKQLDFPAPGAAAEDGPPVVEREKVYIAPETHVELLPTMYLRRALSYQFVRKVLEDTFGKESLAQMHRLTAQGPVGMNLAEELTQMETLFCGAYVVACRELGLAELRPDILPLGAGEEGASECGQLFLRWTASLGSDPDLAPDCRMMVPVFYDQGRRKTKVWVMLGWTDAGVSINYNQKPQATITDPDGKAVKSEEGPELIFTGSWRSLATPVFAEVYVTKILNRDEFRRHCDVYGTKGAILSNLE